MRPNLFDHARSELTQDAVLAWLLAWADPKCSTSDPTLHQVGHSLLRTLVHTSVQQGKTADALAHRTINAVRVETQTGRVDLSVLINEDSEDRFLILIEDKVDAGQHGDQLERYLAEARGRHGTPNVVPIYLKTGSPTPYEREQARDRGFALLLRSALLGVLGSNAAMEAPSDILRDFREHLCRIEDETTAFRTARIEDQDWPWRAWSGFFLEMERTLPSWKGPTNGDGWGYVPNARGGFWGLWWGAEGHALGRTYLQIENGRIAFKLTSPTEGDVHALCRRWLTAVQQAADGTGISVRKTRLRAGQTRTFAELADDFRRTDADGRLDMDRTLEVLHRAERVLRDARASLTS